MMRFRLRTVLLVTTATAILAAIAGPYYRSVGPDDQRRLLILWSVILLSVGASLYLRLRESVRRSQSGAVRYVVFASNDWSFRRRPVLFLLSLAGVGFMVVTATLIMNSEKGSRDYPWYFAYLCGSAAAGLIFGFVRRPVYLCEAGIPIAQGQLAPWKYIRGAAWMANFENKMKLRRYDGDIYIEVPSAIRNDVEAFLREKIGADVVTSTNT
jgi:hypothetical protein